MMKLAKAHIFSSTMLLCTCVIFAHSRFVYLGLPEGALVLLVIVSSVMRAVERKTSKVCTKDSLHILTHSIAVVPPSQ